MRLDYEGMFGDLKELNDKECFRLNRDRSERENEKM